MMGPKAGPQISLIPGMSVPPPVLQDHMWPKQAALCEPYCRSQRHDPITLKISWKKMLKGKKKNKKKKSKINKQPHPDFSLRTLIKVLWV